MFIVSEGISLKIISKETLQVDFRTKMLIKEMCEICNVNQKSLTLNMIQNSLKKPKYHLKYMKIKDEINFVQMTIFIE